MHRSSRIVGASISRSSSTTTTIVCINPTIIYILRRDSFPQFRLDVVLKVDVIDERRDRRRASDEVGAMSLLR